MPEEIDPFTIRITDNLMNEIQSLIVDNHLARHLHVTTDQNGMYVEVTDSVATTSAYRRIFPFLQAMAKKIKDTALDVQIIDRNTAFTLLCGGKVFTIEINNISMRNDEKDLVMEITVGDENEAKEVNFIGTLEPAKKTAPTSEMNHSVAQAAKKLYINLDRASRMLDGWKRLYPKIEKWRKKLDKAILAIIKKHNLYPSHEDSVDETLDLRTYEVPKTTSIKARALADLDKYGPRKVENEEGCPNCDGQGRDTCPLCSGTNIPFPEEEHSEQSIEEWKDEVKEDKTRAGYLRWMHVKTVKSRWEKPKDPSHGGDE